MASHQIKKVQLLKTKAQGTVFVCHACNQLVAEVEPGIWMHVGETYVLRSSDAT